MADTTGTRLWRNFEYAVTNSKVTFNLNIDPQSLCHAQMGHVRTSLCQPARGYVDQHQSQQHHGTFHPS